MIQRGKNDYRAHCTLICNFFFFWPWKGTQKRWYLFYPSGRTIHFLHLQGIMIIYPKLEWCMKWKDFYLLFLLHFISKNNRSSIFKINNFNTNTSWFVKCLHNFNFTSFSLKLKQSHRNINRIRVLRTSILFLKSFIGELNYHGSSNWLSLHQQICTVLLNSQRDSINRSYSIFS